MIKNTTTYKNRLLFLFLSCASFIVIIGVIAIFQEVQIYYAEYRVKKLSQHNFDQHQHEFNQLKEVAEEISTSSTCLLEFSANDRGYAFITSDSISNHQSWTFEGDEHHPNFDTLIQHIGISKEVLYGIRQSLKKVDCETISIDQQGSVTLHYDGNAFYQYQYLFANDPSNVPEDYLKLSEGIYVGLHDSGFFCGDISSVFSK